MGSLTRRAIREVSEKREEAKFFCLPIAASRRSAAKSLLRAFAFFSDFSDHT
jgi:hypothetical protein